VANQKQKYASTEDWLNACLASADQVNRETSQYNVSLADEIKELEAETENLKIAYNEKTAKKSALVNERKKVETKLAEANQRLDRAKFELQNQKKWLHRSKPTKRPRRPPSSTLKFKSSRATSPNWKGTQDPWPPCHHGWRYNLKSNCEL
jgi:chromosome segregation ATPase